MSFRKTYCAKCVKNLRYFLAPKHVLWLLEISGAFIDVNEANVAREFVVKRDDTRLNSNEEVRTPGKNDLYTFTTRGYRK